MVAKVFTSALLGLDGQIVQVEVDIRRGLNHFEIVGLPGKAVREAKERVESAIKNSGFQFPNGRISVNLAPADVPKNSSSYDLPIAVALLVVTDQVVIDTENSLFAGELSLDGQVRGIPGAIVIADFAVKNGFKKIVIPEENVNEASIITKIQVLGINCLRKLQNLYCNTMPEKEIGGKITQEKSGKPLQGLFYSFSHECRQNLPDLSQIRGQKSAKRALEITAAGGHNILMVGSPGSGKSMLGKSIPGILPEMSLQEKIEVTKIYSSANFLKRNKGIVETRPFRNPHYKISQVAMIGGGITPKPGEISLAHRGILFLDEFGEFGSPIIESLRQPLEDREVTVSRANGAITFPSNFILVAAMNPCKCGSLGDPDKECSCSESEIERHRKKVSGPVLDRIDLQIKVGRISYAEVSSKSSEEGSMSVARRVGAARKIQAERYLESSTKDKFTNSEMTNHDIERWIRLDLRSSALLDSAVTKFGLSARGYFRVLKVARTIADLENYESVKKDHIAEALSYRVYSS